jgi:hypothetical protein
MKCENCNKDHDGTYASGRFCSSECARGFSTKEKRFLINDKVSKKLLGIVNKNKKDPYTHICKFCHSQFINKKKYSNYCSIICRNKGFSKNPKSIETKKRMKLAALNSYKNGKKVYGGTTKWYDYKNIRIQGTFELRTCHILDNWKEQRKILNWEYTKDRFSYIGLDEKSHMYLLDFKVWNNDNTFYYIEIKGYKHPNDDLKWKSVRDKGFNLEIWFLEDIKNYEIGLLYQYFMPW